MVSYFILHGKLIVSNITGADIKRLISTLTDKGYSFSTVKQTYNLLNEYFDYLMREEFIKKNPMNAVPTIKKSNYLAKQNKEVLPVCETITVFTDEEIESIQEIPLRQAETQSSSSIYSYAEHGTQNR